MKTNTGLKLKFLMWAMKNTTPLALAVQAIVQRKAAEQVAEVAIGLTAMKSQGPTSKVSQANETLTQICGMHSDKAESVRAAAARRKSLWARALYPAIRRNAVRAKFSFAMAVKSYPHPEARQHRPPDLKHETLQ